MNYRLPITPSPAAAESLWPFLLRTSEAHGYPSPSWLTYLASMGLKTEAIAPSEIEKLAGLYGFQGRTLAQCMWQVVHDGRRHYLEWHGQRVSERFVTLNQAQLCPLCVAEHGYARATWDLTFMLGCVRHHRWLLVHCPSCHRRLSYRRPRLLGCECGASFMDGDGKKLPSSVYELLRLIDAKFSGKAAAYKAPLPNFPTESLRSLSLNAILTLTEILGKHAIGNTIKSNKLDSHTVYQRRRAQLEAAASIFADWPDGFYRLLEHSRQLAESENSGASTLGARLIHFHAALFKNSTCAHEFGFVRKAFLDYGSQAEGVMLDRRCLHRSAGDPDGRRTVSITEYAREKNIDHRTIKKLIDSGQVTAACVPNDGRGRILVDRAKSSMIDRDVIRDHSLNLRKAAQFLSLPQSVLTWLRQHKVIELPRIAIPVSCFRDEDLEAFRLKLTQGVPLLEIDASSTEYMMLAEIMRLKTYNDATKGEVIRAVIDGQLAIHGRVGERIADIALPREPVRHFVRSSIVIHGGDTRIVVEAARLLTCKPPTIFWLGHQHRLKLIETTHGYRVQGESIRKFHRNFLSARMIERIRGISPSALYHRCKLENAKLLCPEKLKIDSYQKFVARADLIKIGLNPTDFPTVLPDCCDPLTMDKIRPQISRNGNKIDHKNGYKEWQGSTKSADSCDMATARSYDD